MFFPPCIQSYQLPLFAEVLNPDYTFTSWAGCSADLPKKDWALAFATRCQSWMQDHTLSHFGLRN